MVTKSTLIKDIHTILEIVITSDWDWFHYSIVFYLEHQGFTIDLSDIDTEPLNKKRISDAEINAWLVETLGNQLNK